jgi:hypothetical protein
MPTLELRTGQNFKLVRAQTLFVASLLFICFGVETFPAYAISVTGVNMFRDFRGPNDVGVAPGDRIQYGANVLGGSSGTFLSATYPPTGFTDPAAPCSPLAVNANFCSNSTAFNANRLAFPWSLTFTKVRKP